MSETTERPHAGWMGTIHDNNPPDLDAGLWVAGHAWKGPHGRQVFLAQGAIWGARSRVTPRSKCFRFPQYFPRYRRPTANNP